MKVIILLLSLIFSFNVFALEAVVTVLETPLLRENDLNSDVVQYLRKGDIIKLHSSMLNNHKYDQMSPSPEKLKEIQDEIENNPDWIKENQFLNQRKEIFDGDELLPTHDRQGNIVYVIREHLYIFYETAREFKQTSLKKDPTDYRLQEPLHKKYPFNYRSGYRGQFLIGLTQPYTESYPYDSSVKAKGYKGPMDVNVTLLNRTKDDVHDRFFLGGTFNIRTFTNTFAFFNQRESTEQGMKMGIGPYITYDAYKGEHNRINLYGSIVANLFNQLIISQKDENGTKDERKYRAYSISPRIGVQYHRKQIAENLDFVIGSMIEMEPATTFRAKNAARQLSWWVSPGNDNFKTRTTFTLGGYLGIQSAY